VQFTALGDTAVAIEVGEVVTTAVLAKVGALTTKLRKDPPRGTVEIVPAATTVTVFYDPCRITGFKDFCAELEIFANKAKLAKVLWEDGHRTLDTIACPAQKIAEKAKDDNDKKTINQ